MLFLDIFKTVFLGKSGMTQTTAELPSAWSYSLQAEPRAFMQLCAERIAVIAQHLSDEE